MILWPLDSSASNVRWRLERNQVLQGSLGNRITQLNRTGDVWSCVVTVPPLQGNDAILMREALMDATMPGEYMAVPDHSYRPRYTGTNGTVDGADQTGGSINLSGLTPGTLYKGDRIGFTTGQVVRVKANATVNGSGEVTVTVDPPIHTAPGNGSAAVIDNPLVPMLLPNGIAETFTRAPLTMEVSFEASEWIGQTITYS